MQCVAYTQTSSRFHALCGCASTIPVSSEQNRQHGATPSHKRIYRGSSPKIMTRGKDTGPVPVQKTYIKISYKINSCLFNSLHCIKDYTAWREDRGKQTHTCSVQAPWSRRHCEPWRRGVTQPSATVTRKGRCAVRWPLVWPGKDNGRVLSEGCVWILYTASWLFYLTSPHFINTHSLACSDSRFLHLKVWYDAWDSLYTHMYRMCVCECECVYHIHVYMHLYIYTSVYIHVYTYRQIYIYRDVDIEIYRCVYI